MMITVRQRNRTREWRCGEQERVSGSRQICKDKDAKRDRQRANRASDCTVWLPVGHSHTDTRQQLLRENLSDSSSDRSAPPAPTQHNQSSIINQNALMQSMQCNAMQCNALQCNATKVPVVALGSRRFALAPLGYIRCNRKSNMRQYQYCYSYCYYYCNTAGLSSTVVVAVVVSFFNFFFILFFSSFLYSTKTEKEFIVIRDSIVGMVSTHQK